MVLLPAFGFPYVPLLFVSALSLIASARRQLILFYKVHREEEMYLSHFMSSCFCFCDSFLNSWLVELCACASHPVTDKFHRALATVQRC